MLDRQHSIFIIPPITSEHRFRTGAQAAEEGSFKDRQIKGLALGRSYSHIGLLQAALDYAEAGWSVFPLAPRSKEPWRGGFNSASISFGRITQWWRENADLNIGLRTGQTTRLVVTDIDGARGRATWSELEAQYGPLTTRRARSGRLDGGTHLYTYLPSDFPADLIVKSGNDVLGPGVDVKADGGYIVAPPSVHESGQLYCWDDPFAEIEETPGWMLDILTATVRPTRSRRYVKDALQPPFIAEHTSTGRSR